MGDAREADPVFVTSSMTSEQDGSQDWICEINLKAFVHKQAIPAPYERASLMQYMQRLGFEAAMKGDYAKADYYSDLNKEFLDLCLEKGSRETIEGQIAAIDRQMTETRKQAVDLKKALDEELRDAQREETEKIERLKGIQRDELNAFDQKWSSEPALRPFSKPSPLLLELREKEKRLILIKEFQEAAAVGKYANRVEQNETRKAQLAAEREAVTLRRQLMERHQRDLEQMETRAATRLAVMEKNRDERLAILTARIRHIEIDKLNVRRSKTADLEAAVNLRPVTAGGLLSPRSHSKLEAFRKQSVVSRLVLRPVKKFPKTLTRQLRMPKYKNHLMPLQDENPDPEFEEL
jgi:hypothetical protein